MLVPLITVRRDAQRAVFRHGEASKGGDRMQPGVWGIAGVPRVLHISFTLEPGQGRVEQPQFWGRGHLSLKPGQKPLRFPTCFKAIVQPCWVAVIWG